MAEAAKEAELGRALEVLDAVDGAVVAAVARVQLDAVPHAHVLGVLQRAHELDHAGTAVLTDPRGRRSDLDAL